MYWRVRPTLRETWRQYERYARGDSTAGMYPERHALRFAAYGALAASTLTRSRWPLAAAALAGAVYARRPLRRAWTRFAGRSGTRVASLAAVPGAMAFIDAAKMWGYTRGLFDRC